MPRDAILARGRKPKHSAVPVQARTGRAYSTIKGLVIAPSGVDSFSK